jgi:hypothetical protein
MLYGQRINVSIHLHRMRLTFESKLMRNLPSVSLYSVSGRHNILHATLIPSLYGPRDALTTMKGLFFANPMLIA